MKIQQEKELAARIAREQIAHTEDDVLKNSYKLKGFFYHTVTSPTIKRFEANFSKYLDNVEGMIILDLGCGHGDLSLALLRKGANVAGIDISQNYIDEAINKAKVAGYENERYEFSVMDAHALTFPDKSFDLVIGSGILHHLDLIVSLDEINRVLKPGGRALFKEPLAAHPLLKLFRLMTPKARTVDEKPLTSGDLREIMKSWEVESSYYGIIAAPVAMLTSILLRPFPNNILLKFADWLELIVNTKPALHPYNQYVLLNLIRK